MKLARSHEALDLVVRRGVAPGFPEPIGESGSYLHEHGPG